MKTKQEENGTIELFIGSVFTFFGFIFGVIIVAYKIKGFLVDNKELCALDAVFNKNPAAVNPFFWVVFLLSIGMMAMGIYGIYIGRIKQRKNKYSIV